MRQNHGEEFFGWLCNMKPQQKHIPFIGFNDDPITIVGSCARLLKTCAIVETSAQLAWLAGVLSLNVSPFVELWQLPTLPLIVDIHKVFSSS